MRQGEGAGVGCTRCWCSRKGYNGYVSSSRPEMHLQIHFDLQLRRKLEAPQRHEVCRQEGSGSCAVSQHLSNLLPPPPFTFPSQCKHPLRTWTFCCALQMTNNFCSFIENVWLELSRNLAGCVCLCPVPCTSIFIVVLVLFLAHNNSAGKRASSHLCELCLKRTTESRKSG